MNAREVAIEIITRLRAQGHEALLAGGCVRDALLAREPSDYDVATDARPDRLARIFPNTAEVGACFGVVLVRMEGHVVEVATFRADGAYSDARRPDSVTFSNPRDDATRRDYTVNALFWSAERPSGEHFDGAHISPAGDGGWIVDFVGGRADLAARLIRAVGDPDQRLAEDHLRALRAVRLGAKLGFSIDPATGAAITRHASDLRGVSRERIGDELRMMLEHPTRADALRTLHELGLLPYVLGGAPAELTWDGDAVSRTVGALPLGAGFPLALAACLTALGQTGAKDLARVRAALLLSNDERDLAHAILTTLPAARREWGAWSVARRKREATRDGFPEMLTLLGTLDGAHAAAIGADVGALARTPSGLKPTPLLTGDTLRSMGYRPGPGFKVVLDEVYDAQLEERVTTEEGARVLAGAAAVRIGLARS